MDAPAECHVGGRDGIGDFPMIFLHNPTRSPAEEDDGILKHDEIVVVGGYCPFFRSGGVCLLTRD